MTVIYRLAPIICLLLVNFGSGVRMGNHFVENLAPDDTELLKEDTNNKSEEEKVEEKEKEKVKNSNVPDLMMNYLSGNVVDTKYACRLNREDCEEMVEMYIRRCKKGDCYTLDNVQLVKFEDGLEVYLPSLNQYVFARSIFEKSKAMKTVAFYNIPRKIMDRFKGPNPNSLEVFNKNILITNLPNIEGKGDHNRMILTDVLYQSTLHYLTYLFENPMSAGRNKYRFFRMFFRWKQRTWLVSTAKNVARVKRLDVGMRNLKALIDSYLLYLNTSGVVGHNRLSLSYSKLVKHALIKLVGDKRVSYLMSDYMMRFPFSPKTFCVGSSPSNCREMLEDYGYRCEDGDCMTMDPVMLLDGKDWLNVKLPQLNELDVAFSLFMGSRARRNLFLDFFLRRKDRISIPVFADKLLKVNTEKVQYNNRDHQVFSKYLYFASVYYQRRSMMGKFKRLFCKSVEKTLKGYLKEILKATPVNLNKERVTAMFVAYRNYLFASKFGNYKEDAAEYAKESNDAFLYYMDTYNLAKENKNNKKEEEKVKEKENTGEEVTKQVNKNKNVFDWEEEDSKYYEDAYKDTTLDDFLGEHPSTSGVMSLKS